MKYALRNILLVIGLFIHTASAWSLELEDVLKAKEPPEGVVFEIVSDGHGFLEEVLPGLKENINRLRQRFPDLPVAIVTHGKEQFDLTTKNRETEAKTHKMVKKLVNEDGIDVHVCGTHAEWYGVMPEDFPDYIDVSAEGPAQINDYEAMGYDVITISD